jgi:hypothetical protein
MGVGDVGQVRGPRDKPSTAHRDIPLNTYRDARRPDASIRYPYLDAFVFVLTVQPRTMILMLADAP